MLSAHDWYRTFATLAGAWDKLPTDRPMDGVDASCWRRQRKWSRDFLFLGSDGSLMSVKWHNIKISLRYSESIEKPIVASPKWTTGGCSNLSCPTLDSAMKSVAQYPNVKPGEEFTGYKKLVAKSA